MTSHLCAVARTVSAKKNISTTVVCIITVLPCTTSTQWGLRGTARWRRTARGWTTTRRRTTWSTKQSTSLEKLGINESSEGNRVSSKICLEIQALLATQARWEICLESRARLLTRSLLIWRDDTPPELVNQSWGENKEVMCNNLSIKKQLKILI